MYIQYTYIQVYIHIHTGIYVYILYAQTPTYMHYTHYTHIFINTQYTNIHTALHTQIYTYTHTYTQFNLEQVLKLVRLSLRLRSPDLMLEVKGQGQMGAGMWRWGQGQ